LIFRIFIGTYYFTDGSSDAKTIVEGNFMRKNVRFGLAAILGGSIASFSAAAGAADLPYAMPVKAPVFAPVSDWSGFYIGLGVGFRSTTTDSAVTAVTQNGANALGPCIAALAGFGGCTTGEPLNDTAFRLNPYIGANLQIAPRWVVGIEGDVGFANKTTTLGGMGYPVTLQTTGIAADSFSVKTTWDASARARLGYLVNPAVMLYATGGAAWLHLEATSTCNAFINGICSPQAGSGPLIITDSTNKLGWTVGGGLEAMLSPNWIARGEYRFADYGTISNTDRRGLVGGVIDQISSYDLRVRTHTATFGLAYKFGGNPGTAVAAVVPPPTAMAASSWSGPYLGLGLGARSSLPDANMTAFTVGGVNALTGTCNTLATFGGCVTGEPLNGTAFRAAPYAGFNWLIAPRWIAGLEGDFGFADKTTTLAGMTYPFSGSMSGRAVEMFSVRTTWDASVRARVGFLVNPSVLLYGTGGAAFLHVESASTCGTFTNALCSPGTTSGPLVITDAKNRVGWTAGGGIEAVLWKNWLGRAEYRFADFGTFSNTDIRTGGLGAVASYDLRVKTHTASLGVAYKFD